MVLTPSTMQELGMKAPDFTLPTAQGGLFSLSEQHIDKGLLVIFMCNHCPYVIHIRAKLVERIVSYQDRGITVVAINSNDYTTYTDDRPEKMVQDARTFGYTFPYLVDEAQNVAKAYGAACTPDLFLYDAEKKLIYRGQFDGARPGNNAPVTGNDLTMAIDALIAGKVLSAEQKPSIGCNIKWKAGNEPHYFAPPAQ